jgi:Domain of unknown function (DUF4349)
MRIRSLVVCLLPVTLLGCNTLRPAKAGPGKPEKAVAFDRASPSDEAPALAGVAASPGARGPAPGTPEQKSDLPRAVDLPSSSAMIIRTGTASIEVDSLEAGLAGLRRLTAQVGGFVANTSLQSGREQLQQATLEIKVPAQRFDELTSGLQPLGRVEFVNVTAEDVGEEFVDITARVANGHRLEERLVDLLATRTGRLQDVLAVERELARVREEIERHEGRLRYLRTRAAMSTLAVTLHEARPIVGDHPGYSVIGEAFRQAWRNCVQLVAGLIAAMGILVPVAVLAGGAIFLVRKYWKKA